MRREGQVDEREYEKTEGGTRCKFLTLGAFLHSNLLSSGEVISSGGKEEKEMGSGREVKLNR